MFVNTKCTFCEQMFDYDSSSDDPTAECPHCGKSNTVELLGDTAAPVLTVQHGAPTLAGVKECPVCKSQIERDAVLCIHCGTNLATGQKAKGSSWLAAHGRLVGLISGALVVGAIALGFLLWPKQEDAPPVYTTPASTGEQLAAIATETALSSRPQSEIVATASEALAKVEAVATPPPPPKPTAAELAAEQAAQQAEAERAAFAEKKFAAEQALRFDLDNREPLYVTNELMELRRRDGMLNKGTLTGFAGTGTNRVVLVATPTGEIGVPLIALDSPTRRRLDPEYREAFIQHIMSTRLPEPTPVAPGK